MSGVFAMATSQLLEGKMNLLTFSISQMKPQASCIGEEVENV